MHEASLPGPSDSKKIGTNFSAHMYLLFSYYGLGFCSFLLWVCSMLMQHLLVC